MKLFVALALVAFIGVAVEGRALQARDLKDTLTTKGNALLKKADEAITKLEADKKAHEVTVVKAEEAAIKKLLADLTAATDATKITHIEHQLTQAEHKLEFELQKIAHAHPATHAPHVTKAPAKRDLKSDLTTKGNDLLKKADEAITKLTADKKTHEVTVVKSEEAVIKKLLADLEAATDATKITHIEHQLTQAEHKLQFELTKIGHHGNPVHPVTHAPHVPATHAPAKRDVKSDLITKGNDLLKKADEAIKKAEADKKTHEVALIKGEESRIKKLITDLEAATDAAKVTTLEHELTRAETRLAHTLEHAAHPVTHAPHVTKAPAKRDLKSDLTTKGNDLLKKADEAITKLTGEKKTHEVALIKAEESRIKKLIADLDAATETAKISTLEHELARAEQRLSHTLEHAGHVGPIHVPTHSPIHHN